jgi:hypothetical protein
VALQEELDWKCYRIFGITKDDYTCSRGAIPGIRFGERAFELVMARRMASGDIDANWFDRHGVIPRSDLPTHWPVDYREVVEKRMALIESDDTIQLLEQPEFKRRWITKPWDGQHLEALREWLLDRIERSEIWQGLQLASCAQLADCVRNDPEFADMAARFRGRPDFEWTPLLVELLQPESVPLLSRNCRVISVRRNGSSVDDTVSGVPSSSRGWSLAWAILALAAHRRPIASLCSSLAALPDLPSTEDTSTLALACLALDYRCGLSAFGVIE